LMIQMCLGAFSRRSTNVVLVRTSWFSGSTARPLMAGAVVSTPAVQLRIRFSLSLVPAFPLRESPAAQ
jgi:hypothetical protein